jgi:hypothetical protein
MKSVYLLLMGTLLVAGCNSAQPPSPPTVIDYPAEITRTQMPIQFSPTNPVSQATPTVTASNTPSIKTKTPQKTTPSRATSPTFPPSTTPTPTLTFTPGSDAWKETPIIPSISDTVVQIYQRGLELGNNTHAFSKVGDCGSTPAWFLGDFDRGPEFYHLGSYQNLAAVIQQFQGSFDRTSMAARSGFNASALNITLWTDLTYCKASETPLACEYRIHRPAISFIMLGTNDIWHPDEFEPQMRKIIEFSIESGVVPILSTKADNMEGDGSINSTIARLASEYDIPLWNFWLVVQPLPDKGLQEDHAHLTFGRNFFDDPQAMTKAWPLRNLTALQILDTVWRKVTGQSN